MLQMVAWSQMLAEYSAQKGLAAGIEETFDGEHGCPMCRLIEEGQAKEREKGPVLPTRSEQLVKLFPASERLVLSAVRQTVRDLVSLTFAAPLQMTPQWIASPVKPPPRETVA